MDQTWNSIMSETKKWFAKGRHLNDVGVSLYVDALKLEKAAKLPEEILLHVQKCQRCKLEIMGLYTLLQDQDYFHLGPHPYFDALEAGSREKGIPIYRIAAGFAIIVTLGAVAYFLGYLDVPQKTPVSASNLEQSVSIDTSVLGAKPGQPSKVERHRPKAADYAARFTESPNLENMVGSALRSVSARVISPAIGESLGGEILFRWETDVPPPFRLQIVDNREEIVEQAVIQIPRYLLKKRLTDGLYYSKFMAGGELLYVGKFFVTQKEELP